MNSTTRRRILDAVMLTAWGTALTDASPWGFDLNEQTRLIVLCVAVVSTLASCISRHHRPVQEIYDMGYEAGRRQGHIEAVVEASPSVVPFRRRA